MMKRIILISMLIVLMFALPAAADGDLMYNSCEEAIEGAELKTGSVDGTQYYSVSGCDMGFLPYEMADDFVYELDVRFREEGCGFSFMKKGKWNSCIRIKDGNFALQTGGNSYTKYCEIELNKWYHVTFVGRTGKDVNAVTYGHLILEKYDESGKKNEKQVFENVNLRNNAPTHFVNVFGCDVDNLRAYLPLITKLEMTCDAEAVTSGGSVQFSVARYFDDLKLHGIDSDDISFEVRNIKDNTLISENAAVDLNGKMTVDPLCDAMEVSVKAISKSTNLVAEKVIKIMSGDVFTLTGIGVNKENSKVTAISFRKNFAAYKDEVTFVIAFYDAMGNFKSLDYKTVSAKDMSEGEGKVKLSMVIPEGAELLKSRAYAITLFGGINKDLIVTADKMPQPDGKGTVLVLKKGSDISKIKKDDIIYFDVVGSTDELNLPDGDVYVMSNILYKVTK